VIESRKRRTLCKAYHLPSFIGAALMRLFYDFSSHDVDMLHVPLNRIPLGVFIQLLRFASWISSGLIMLLYFLLLLTFCHCIIVKLHNWPTAASNNFIMGGHRKHNIISHSTQRSIYNCVHISLMKLIPTIVTEVGSPQEIPHEKLKFVQAVALQIAEIKYEAAPTRWTMWERFGFTGSIPRCTL